MKRNPLIVCVGEALVDFFATGRVSSHSESPTFTGHPGGAAANVSVGISKLGVRSAFIGSLGDDGFGNYVRKELVRHGVDVSGVLMLNEFKTRLAFVSVSPRGERDFEFWERVPADTRLRLSQKIVKGISRSHIVHFSSFLLLHEPSRSTSLNVAAQVRAGGCLVSFDPNLRLSLWKSLDTARLVHLKMIRRCNILRLNMEEAFFLGNRRSLTSAVGWLHETGPSVVVVTLGEDGCYCSTPRGSAFVPPFKVRVKDTTGCGDGFLAGLLTGIVLERKTIDQIPLPCWFNICRRANAVGALTATKQGVIDALPTKEELLRFLKRGAW